MEDYRFQSWKEISDGKINADIIINGNSRALSHFNPKILDSVLNKKTYNLGIGGHPFNVQDMKYRFYLTHNSQPRFIIQNVDFGTLVKKSILGHEREQVFPYFNDKFLRKELTSFGFNKTDIYAPIVRYIGYQMVIKNGLLEFFRVKHYKNRYSYKGFSPEKGGWNPSELNKIKTIEFQLDRQTHDLFELYLKNCSKNKIRVILVNSPVYHGAMAKVKNKAQMNTYFQNIAKKYGHIYLDYTSDSICLDTTNFTVAVHLNEKGANIFSTNFAKDITTIVK